MPLSAEVIDRVANDVYQAEQKGATIPRLIESYPDATLDDAIAVLDRLTRKNLDAGCRLAGWKLANSRVPMPANALVQHPVKGPIFDRNLHDEIEPLSLAALVQPRIEAEICFLIDRDLKGPGVTVPEVLGAARVLPAYEIVDARRQWDGDLRNLMADYAGHARLVVGGVAVPAGSIDLRTVGCVLERNGEVVGSGAGGAVMGHPARAVAYLANELGARGEALRAGQFVTTGSLVTPLAMATGDTFTAYFGGLGRISLRVVP